MNVALRFIGAVLFAILAGTAAHAVEPFTVVADGLQSPRGLTFGPGGRLYVAQAGSDGGYRSCSEWQGSASGRKWTLINEALDVRYRPETDKENTDLDPAGHSREPYFPQPSKRSSIARKVALLLLHEMSVFGPPSRVQSEPDSANQLICSVHASA